MKYYCVAEMEITDQSWVPAYVENVTRMVERYGGKYLSRTPHVETLEGEAPPPHILLLIEWPSRESALAFYESDEYRPYLQSRSRGAKSRLLLARGEDIAGAARMTD